MDGIDSKLPRSWQAFYLALLFGSLMSKFSPSPPPLPIRLAIAKTGPRCVVDWVPADVVQSESANEKVQPVGPMLIFDKSFLQSLTVDEAVILDQMFSCVVTPLFFVETMADLTKETARGRTAEQVVGGLAERTPVAHSYINTYHQDVVLEDLLGRREQIRLLGRWRGCGTLNNREAHS